MECPELFDALPSKKTMASIKFLRNCFRRDIIGDRRSPSFATFWRAVQLFAPDVEVSLETPTSSRNTQELQPAFDLVCQLMGKLPSSMAVFLANGSSPKSSPVPHLMDAVNAYLKSPFPRPTAPGLLVRVCLTSFCASVTLGLDAWA